MHRGRDPGAIAGSTRWIVPVVLVTAVVLAFAPGLDGAFLWDDTRSIGTNPYVLQLSWRTVARTSRPLAQLTFALDHTRAGLDPRPYHVTNLLVHGLAALALYVLILQVLARTGERKEPGARNAWIAGALSALWAVHPLQTESVTYVVQRAEALAGLFTLITLVALGRAATPGAARGWSAAAVAAAVLAMASKPVAAVLPVVALLWDRALFAGSFPEVLRRRPILHAGVAASALLVPVFLAAGRGDWAESTGAAGTGFTPASYALTQIGVVAHYLRLVFWPHPLVLDYGWPAARGPADLWPGALVLAPLVAISAWGLARNRMVGLLGGAFAVLLAPTSSFYPVADAAFEHRMYLPLAAVLAALAAVAGGAFRRAVHRAMPAALVATIAVALVLALGLTTRARTRDYRSAEAMWRLNVAQRPDHPRPRIQLATALAEQGRLEEAEREYREVLRRHPEEATAFANLGSVREQQGAVDEAMELYTEALRLDPRMRGARCNLGVLLARKHRLPEAIVQLEEVVRRNPEWVEGRYDLALALSLAGRREEAREHYRRVLELEPGHVLAQRALERLDAFRP